MEYGQTITQPADPAVDGYVFKGWVTDEGAFDFSTQIKKDTYIKARLLKKLELKSGPDINNILIYSLSGGSAKKFAKSSEKKDSQYYLDNNQKIPVWYESETIWYYLEPDSIMTLAQNSSRMFADCSYIEAIETCDFDTSKVTNMSHMFVFCKALTSLDVSNFDTSKVTNMEAMFYDCESLTSLDVSKFDTSNVTNMYNMFCWCRYLTSLDVSNFDTSKVRDMSYMFNDCSNLTSLDVSKFDTSKVTDMSYMFSSCKELTSLNVSNFNTSEVTNMRYMFKDCYSMTGLNLSNFDTSNVTDMSCMFGRCWALTSLDVSKFDTSKVTNMGSMFMECNNLTSLDVSKFDTSKVTNMESMFKECNNLTSLDVSKFDTSKVTNMVAMFNWCKSLTTIYAAAGTDWGSIENINSNNMFLNCYSLKGGNNTVYDESKTDKTYACIDGLDGKPGYFTIRPGEYEIIYILPEGVTNPNPKGYTVETATITLQDVSREGYKFLGWYDAETGGNKVESIVQGSSGTKKLWARWGVTATFSVNGQITENITVEYGQTITQPEDPAVDGYVFKGWVTDEGAFDFSTQIKKDTYIKARLLKKLELKSGPDINSILKNSLSGDFAKKFAKSSEKKDSQYYLDNNQKIPVWYEQESETIWYYLEPDGIMTLAQNSSAMFANCRYIEAIETCDFDTSNVTDMSYMFGWCSNLTSLDVSKFDTSKVTNMESMFKECYNLTSLDVSKFDTSKVTSMGSMFKECYNLTSLDLSSFNTSKTKNMSDMFACCAGLKELDLSNFVILNDTEDNPDVHSMFDSCNNLATIYAAAGTNWGRIENIYSDNMFFYCNSLKGGNNTVYDVSKTDKTYARIDGLNGKPGYFTVKPAATE